MIYNDRDVTHLIITGAQNGITIAGESQVLPVNFHSGIDWEAPIKDGRTGTYTFEITVTTVLHQTVADETAEPYTTTMRGRFGKVRADLLDSIAHMYTPDTAQFVEVRVISK